MAPTSRVGRRRGAADAVLFRRPLPEPGKRLSTHPALQGPTLRGTPEWQSKSCGHVHYARLPPVCRGPLCPFALWSAFPTAVVGRHAHDYYEHSVAGIDKLRGVTRRIRR